MQPDVNEPLTPPLTPLEIETIDMQGKVWNNLCKIVGSGSSRSGDLQELCAHVHAIQQAIMSNAAARAYPDQFRPLGGSLRSTPAEES